MKARKNIALLLTLLSNYFLFSSHSGGCRRVTRSLFCAVRRFGRISRAACAAADKALYCRLPTPPCRQSGEHPRRMVDLAVSVILRNISLFFLSLPALL